MNTASEKTMEGISGIAFLRKCVIAPRKMRMVADLIRGKNVVLALNIVYLLLNSPFLLKCLIIHN